jgi:hypothetical protein
MGVWCGEGLQCSFTDITREKYRTGEEAASTELLGNDGRTSVKENKDFLE